ncbi:glycosyltransferase family 4 protein [Bizionia psychrotolerans]|uniref:glycosyltransferase family 4 protein n=1 Tax=Bizionia psychrotolerans TaxID=1492901 RepID=UPI0006523533|nr:glycosyltransferase family 4 protein [Bizionia psychrotolerans]
MTNVLYIGNHLNQARSNISAIGVLGPLLTSEGYRLYSSSSKSNKLLRLIDMLYSVCRYAKRADVVLIDTYSTSNFYYAFLVSQLCRLLKLPYIPILHGGNLPSRLQHSPQMSRLLFRYARCLVSPSLYLQTQFEAAGFKRVVYIPNSVSIEQYIFQQKTHDRIRLLWVRSFSDIYNPQLAVHVLKRLQDAGYACELCMIGPDTGDGSFQTTQKLASDLDVAVRFTGKLSKTEWLALAADYTIFINTTNFDNMPVSVIEAMALGLPVVSTDVGGMPYLINHGVTGLLVPPYDADAFEGAIIRLVSGVAATQTMAAAAREMVEGFDWGLVRLEWKKVL